MTHSQFQKVFVQSFGCRASQADGAGLEAAFAARGLQPVSSAAEADLVILNTCTVTSTADSDARHLIRKLKRENETASVLVTGCYAQRAPQEISELDGVRWVVGNSHKTHIPDLVLGSAESEPLYHGQILASDMRDSREFLAAPILSAYNDRTRPTLKVQDGCSNKCSFCIIPSVRGRSRSATLERILTEMQQLSEHFVEVVLSGINLGRWGRDLPGGLRFIDLLRAILAETSIKQLRISSVEPMDWSAELLELMANEPRIARHVHIPLQSASDAVLKRMFRKYRVRHYHSRMELAHRLMPDCAIGADVMTGFPGETDEEFEETRRFIATNPFTYLHVFTYSEREGTEAAQSASPVPMDVRRKRTGILRQLSEEKNRMFRESMAGKKLIAVTLNPHKALTGNFLNVELSSPREPNRLIEVEIGQASETGLREKTVFPILSAS